MDRETRGVVLPILDSFDLFEDNEWGLPPKALMLGWAEVESGYNPAAIRYEPKYRYLVGNPREGSTEWCQQKISWGLYQLMGGVLREHGFDARYLSEALDPAINAKYAAKHLLRGARPDDDPEVRWTAMLARYNGGMYGNKRPPFRRQEYVDKVVAAAKRARL